MKKSLLFVLILSQLYGEPNLQWNSTLLPDLRLTLEPILIDESQGVSGFFEGGREIFRFNGTYGREMGDTCFAKVSLEYLKQRLGLAFLSGREHKWVNQGAIGLAYRFSLAELTLNYSHAPDRNLFSHVIPNRNALCDKKIAGSHAFGMSCLSSYVIWEGGTMTGGLVYDYVHFKRKFQRNRGIQGLGFKIGVDQSLDYGRLHLGLAVEAPFIFYEASFASRLCFFGCPLDVALYGQRVHGLKSIPSSSRMGIEIGFNLERMMACDFRDHSSHLMEWLATPAVYMPEVLVMKDEKERDFCLAPLACGTIGDLEVSTGFFTLDMASYFSGTRPMVYNSSTLPGNLTLNPVTGKITGTIDGSLKGTYGIVVKATNYSGEAMQTMFLHFN